MSNEPKDPRRFVALVVLGVLAIFMVITAVIVIQVKREHEREQTRMLPSEARLCFAVNQDFFAGECAQGWQSVIWSSAGTAINSMDGEMICTSLLDRMLWAEERIDSIHFGVRCGASYVNWSSRQAQPCDRLGCLVTLGGNDMSNRVVVVEHGPISNPALAINREIHE